MIEKIEKHIDRAFEVAAFKTEKQAAIITPVEGRYDVLLNNGACYPTLSFQHAIHLAVILLS